MSNSSLSWLQPERWLWLASKNSRLKQSYALIDFNNTQTYGRLHFPTQIWSTRSIALAKTTRHTSWGNLLVLFYISQVTKWAVPHSCRIKKAKYNCLIYVLQRITLCLLQASWRRVVSTAVTLGIPTPAFSTALAFFDGYRSARLPANLIQVICLIECWNDATV